MQVRREPQQQFKFSGSQLRNTREFYHCFERIDKVLREHPEILDVVHEALVRNYSTSEGGRRSRITSEQVLRIFIVMQLEGWTFREVSIFVDSIPEFRSFVGLGVNPMVDFTTLDRMWNAIGAEAWKKMNDLLARKAIEQGKVEGLKLRVDTTVYETNIAYPTDSKLLWDGYRVLSKHIAEIRRLAPQLVGDRRFHRRMAKKLHLAISRRSRSGRSLDAARKALYSKLIQMVCHLVERSREVAGKIEQGAHRVLSSKTIRKIEREHEKIISFLPLIDRVIDQSFRRTQLGETISNDEKIFSIFEPHTELIQKGKANKPMEFGHVVSLQQVSGGFITSYGVHDSRPEDASLIDQILEDHENLFGCLPDSLAADKGFYKSAEKLEELSEKIPHVSIGKKGRRTPEEKAREHDACFRALQRFRAGIEGTISYLKRSLKLARCLYRSFRHYAASVGSIVFVHNLVVLARG